MTAEEQLLGCIIAGADPTDLHVRPEDFWDIRNEWIFRACLTVGETGRRCDPQTVTAALGDKAEQIPDALNYLAGLVTHAIPLNAPTFAEKVRKTADRRSLVEVAHRIVQHADDPDRDPADLREDARNWLEQPGREDDSSTESMADLLPGYIDEVENGTEPGLSTPWPDLDWYLNGLHPGRLYTIGGRPGGGKSVMMSNVAAHFATRHARPVFFATLEMPKKELVGRVVAAAAQVSQTNLLTRRMTENDWQRVTDHTSALAAMPLHINDKPQTLQSIRKGARDVKRRHGLALIVVDYLQLITPPDKRISRQQQIGEITRGLKALAKELDAPVLTASQLRRPQNPKEEPTLNDLRESGDIEADSDGVILLHTPDEAKPWDLIAFVRKNRSGPKGPVKLFFDTGRALMNSVDWKATA